jgi:type II secretory pathway component PulF
MKLIMDSGTNLEPWWKTYLKAITFLSPALLLWQFARVFLFPKLETIWRDAGVSGSDMQWLMNTAKFLIQHGGLVMGAFALFLLLMEFYWRTRAGYRRLSVGIVVFLLNAAVLIDFTAMCSSALVAAPALRQIR